MGQVIAGRGGDGASRAGEISEGTQIDVLGEDNEMWWPACVTGVDKKKKRDRSGGRDWLCPENKVK